MKPKLALTLGDPAGIGPEITAKICMDPQLTDVADLMVIGQAPLLAAGAKAMGLPCPQVKIVECGPLTPPIVPGHPSIHSGALAGAFVGQAVILCQTGQIDGFVTAPISKEYLNLAGYNYPGHTEMLGDLAGGVKPVMLLAGDKITVSLVTVHCPLRQAAGLLSKEKIRHAIITTWQWLHALLQRPPRLAVAALNPHAGEGGLLGTEEKRLIIPVVDELKGQGFDLSGPLPADTLFWQLLTGKKFDAVVCMYHDQGLIPFKMLHFEDGVNVSMGLPFIRTSPDHGVAFELAGKGLASARSMKAAVLLAARLAAKQRHDCPKHP
jgi:4-hydroxythreonine-4-phosphate dehydrogenase